MGLVEQPLPSSDGHFTLDYNALRDALKENRVLLLSATQAHHQAYDLSIRAKQALDKRVARALYEGDIEGRNEAERAACAKVKFAPLHEALEKAESALRGAAYDLRVVEINADFMKSILRLTELAQREVW